MKFQCDRVCDWWILGFAALIAIQLCQEHHDIHDSWHWTSCQEPFLGIPQDAPHVDAAVGLILLVHLGGRTSYCHGTSAFSSVVGTASATHSQTGSNSVLLEAATRHGYI